MRNHFLRAMISSTAVVIFPSIAAAQSEALEPVPARSSVDEQGVNLINGSFLVGPPTISIGGEGGLLHSRVRVANGWRHNYLLSVRVSADGTDALISIGSGTLTFTKSAGAWLANQSAGRVLFESESDFQLTLEDGTKYIFSKEEVTGAPSYYGLVSAIGTQIIYPNAEVVNLHYKRDSYRKFINNVPIYFNVIRLNSVISSRGFQLKFEYKSNTLPVTFSFGSAINDWYEVAKVTALNRVSEFCSATADTCALTNEWPSLSYSWANTQQVYQTFHNITDNAGNVTRYRIMSGQRIIGVKRPSEDDDGTVVSYDQNMRVSSINVHGDVTRNYSWDVNASGKVVGGTSTDSLGRLRTVTVDPIGQNIITDSNAYGQVTSYTYNSNGEILTVVGSGGQATQLIRDPRGNVTSTTSKPRPGSALSDIVISATFPSDCVNPLTCNKPVTTTNARGGVTNYEYDPTHGGVTVITEPSSGNLHNPTLSARAETRMSYGLAQARYRTSINGLSTASPIHVLTTVSSCRTGTVTNGCLGTADERRTAVGYLPGTVANNAKPNNILVQTGSGEISSASALGYDIYGNQNSIDGQLAGSDDKSQRWYNSLGQLVAVVGPDPDGTGGNPRVGERFAYNADGKRIAHEIGTMLTLSDPSAVNSGFVVGQRQTSGYDKWGRLERSAIVSTSGTTQYSVTQYSYDIAGRLSCTAQRSDAPSITSALPESACLQSPGLRDRITKREYGAADELLRVLSGVGTNLAHVSYQAAYNTLSSQALKLKTETDAEGNLTFYTYDDMLRTDRIRYPSPISKGSYNNGDDQRFWYDQFGFLKTFRTRRGELLNFSYDDLGRVITKLVPSRSGLAATHTRNVHYQYDLHNNLLNARFDSFSGEGVEFSYDAFGHRSAETSTMDGVSRAVSYQRDNVGRVISIVHPDGEFFNWAYDFSNRPTSLLKGGNALISFSYDGLGRISEISRFGTAPEQGFFYNPAGQLGNMTISGGNGASNGVFNYNYNPFGELESEYYGNWRYRFDAYPSSERNVNYIANGLNQYTNINSNLYSYDGNGNLSGYTEPGPAGGVTNSYVYDVENRLVRATVNGGVTSLRYDPMGRLYEVGNSGNITRFVYSGDELVAEYNGAGHMQNRYVHGQSPGDDPLLSFDGSSTTIGNARFLYGDLRGSIILSANSGDVTSYRRSWTYDVFGMPGNGISGANESARARFGYTGQIWIPEIGLNHYKARAYSPTLGRFLQPDPIGYSDGMNLYSYVGNSPIIRVDPKGRDCTIHVNNQTYTWVGKTNCEGGEGDSSVIIVNAPKASEPTRPIEGPDRINHNNGSVRGGGRAERPEAGGQTPDAGDTCSDVASEPGWVIVVLGTGSFVPGVGVSGEIGSFANLSTGSGGFFYARGANVGYEGGVAIQAGLYRSVADFQGTAANANGSVAVASGSVSVSGEGKLIGGTFGTGGSAGGSGSVTNTVLFNCTLSGN